MSDLPIIIDYGGDLVSVYDPVSVMPYSEPPITERTRYKKLNAEQKAAFKSMFVSAVTVYWDENRLIPFGEDMADIRKWMLEAFAEEYGILLKEDSELKNYLMTLAISTLNKGLNRVTDFPFFACGVFYLPCKRCCSFGSDWMRCNSSATICRTSALMRL